MNRTKSLLGLLVLILCIPPIFQCKGQTSGFKVVAEPYQWNDDMKRLKITTPERGLTFKIIISNEDSTEPVTIDKLLLDVKVYYGDEDYFKFYKQINIDYIYLPSNEDYTTFVPVDFGHGDIVGSYRAELKYGTKGYLPQQKIEPFPFEFRVLGEDLFQQEIEQNRGGTTIIIPIEIQVSGGVISISVAILAIYLWKKKKPN